MGFAEIPEDVVPGLAAISNRMLSELGEMPAEYRDRAAAVSVAVLLEAVLALTSDLGKTAEILHRAFDNAVHTATNQDTLPAGVIKVKAERLMPDDWRLSDEIAAAFGAATNQILQAAATITDDKQRDAARFGAACFIVERVVSIAAHPFACIPMVQQALQMGLSKNEVANAMAEQQSAGGKPH